MRVLPYGDAALLIELRDLDSVLALYTTLHDAPPDGVVDLVPAARTLLVVLDARADPAAVAAAIRAASARPPLPGLTQLVELPTRYDGADLDEVAALSGLSVAEVVARHSDPEYLVGFTGFAPGFAYLLGLDPQLQVPRRETPRARVPSGSVAVADQYTAVYPRPSPGGWRLLGTCPVELFDVSRQPPALLAPGTRVRFCPVAS